MSEKGKRKKYERLVKKANRLLLVPDAKATPHDRKLWKKGASRLLLDLAHGEAHDSVK